MPWNQPFKKASTHMIGILLKTPGKVPNNNITKALSNRPTVEKYFGLERSDALPMTNLLTPYATDKRVMTIPRSALV